MTVADTALDVEPVAFVEPLYVAVNVKAPTGSFEVVNVATPPVSSFEPTDVVPLRNTTVPVGTGTPGSTGPTIALNVTNSPATLDATSTLNEVVVVAFATVSVTAVDVDGNTVADPPYVAVNDTVPTGNFVVLSDAMFPTTPAEPNAVVPRLNVTDPVTGTVEETVAVKVTD